MQSEFKRGGGGATLSSQQRRRRKRGNNMSNSSTRTAAPVAILRLLRARPWWTGPRPPQRAQRRGAIPIADHDITCLQQLALRQISFLHGSTHAHGFIRLRDAGRMVTSCATLAFIAFVVLSHVVQYCIPLEIADAFSAGAEPHCLCRRQSRHMLQTQNCKNWQPIMDPECSGVARSASDCMHLQSASLLAHGRACPR